MSLKEAIVRPLLKKPSLDPEDQANCHPKSNLPFLWKVVERKWQNSFRSSWMRHRHPTPLSGLGLELRQLCHQLDKGGSMLLILLDLSAAFETADHSILVDCLLFMGVCGNISAWFLSFFQRFQWKVAVGNVCSATHSLKCGVPQNMIPFPVLYKHTHTETHTQKHIYSPYRTSLGGSELDVTKLQMTSSSPFCWISSWTPHWQIWPIPFMLWFIGWSRAHWS